MFPTKQGLEKKSRVQMLSTEAFTQHAKKISQQQ